MISVIRCQNIIRVTFFEALYFPCFEECNSNYFLPQIRFLIRDFGLRIFRNVSAHINRFILISLPLRGCIHTFEAVLRLFIREKLRFSTISQKSGIRRFPSRHAIHGFLRKSRFAQLSPELIAQNGIFL